MNCRDRIRLKRGTIAEFAPVLFVSFLLAVFPCINLLATAIGYSNAYLMCTHWACLAAGATGIESASMLVRHDARLRADSGLMRIVKLEVDKPLVYVVRTNIVSGAIQYIGPMERAEPPLSTTDFVYEYLIRTRFTQSPFVSLAQVPGLQEVPALGSDFTYHLSQLRMVEHLDGLVKDPLVEIPASAEEFNNGSWKDGWPPFNADRNTENSQENIDLDRW